MEENDVEGSRMPRMEENDAEVRLKDTSDSYHAVI